MNLTPTQKADELIEKFRPFAHINDDYVTEVETKNATKCAIIAVDEILNLYKKNWNIDNSFWQEVKTILTDRL